MSDHHAHHARGTHHTGPDPRRSMLYACTGVAIAVVIGTFISALIGATLLSFALLGAGVWRACAPRATRAAGIAVRGKWFDVAFYIAAGLAIAILALTYPEALTLN